MSAATLKQTAPKSNLHPWLTLTPTEATAELEDWCYYDFLIWDGVFGAPSKDAFWQAAANDEAIPFDVSFLTRAGRV